MELAYCSAAELAELIREGQVSAVEALDYFLQRVERHNAALNAVVATNIEAARIRAREADDARARGELWGPLHGVPMTVKESFEVAGMPTTSGAPELRDYRSTTNALSVQRLIDAGAVVFGKTNVPLYTGDLQTYNEVYGTTNNPWDVARTPGGSSGGSAAALAAGLTPLELGSDLAGSIRTPSAFCGVCGHKPSFGITSTRGHVPGPPGSLSRPDLSVAGPMARTVNDLELALDLLLGPDPLEARGWRIDLPPPRHEAAADFRVAAWLDDPAFPVDAQVVSVLEELLERLNAEKVPVDDTARPQDVEFAKTHELFYRMVSANMGPGLPPKTFERLATQVAEAGPDAADYSIDFARGATQSHAQWLRSNEKRERLRQAWCLFFKNFDVLLCPVVNTLPFAHDQRPLHERTLDINGVDVPYMDVTAWAGLGGVAYLPATVVPVGQSREGLPIAVQIIGPYLEDRTALAFARHIEDLMGGFRAPQGF